MASEFSRLLRQRRREAGLSQHRLAALLDFTQSYLSQLETGFRHPTSSGVIHRLADAIGCDADELCVAAKVLPADMQGRVGEIVEMWRGRQT